MSVIRWSKTTWEVFLSQIFRPDQAFFFPHKFFRWNANGVYEDCFFPVPCQHVLGGESLLGKSIQEVFPNENARLLLQAFRQSRKTQSFQDLQLVLSAGKATRVAVVRLFPFQTGVLGFVTDHFMDGRPVLTLSPQDPSLAFLRSGAHL